GGPVVQRGGAGNAQAGADDASPPALLGGDHRPVEEGQVRAGIAAAVGVEEVVAAWVVLVDGLLDQPHAHDLRVEGQVPLCVLRHGGEVVDTGKLHAHIKPARRVGGNRRSPTILRSGSTAAG